VLRNLDRYEGRSLLQPHQHVVERIAARLASIDGLIAAICREQLDRVRELNRRINELEREIKPLIHALAPTLLSIPGCGALTAAKLVGETAGAQRFRSKSAYARWNGWRGPRGRCQLRPLGLAGRRDPSRWRRPRAGCGRPAGCGVGGGSGRRRR
jgi:Transposase IS116/IS110/IS902 family